MLPSMLLPVMERSLGGLGDYEEPPDPPHQLPSPSQPRAALLNLQRGSSGALAFLKENSLFVHYAPFPSNYSPSSAIIPMAGSSKRTAV